MKTRERQTPSEKKFTAGSWKHSTGENLDGIDHRWISADGKFIADLGIVGGPVDSEANARLIAAAPELYEVLKILVEQEWHPRLSTLDSARAALAKASPETISNGYVIGAGSHR